MTWQKIPTWLKSAGKYIILVLLLFYFLDYLAYTKLSDYLSFFCKHGLQNTCSTSINSLLETIIVIIIFFAFIVLIQEGRGKFITVSKSSILNGFKILFMIGWFLVLLFSRNLYLYFIFSLMLFISLTTDTLLTKKDNFKDRLAEILGFGFLLSGLAWIMMEIVIFTLPFLCSPSLKICPFKWWSQKQVRLVKKSNIEKRTYTNSRFGYSIEYPKEWLEGKEADNGDGKALYKDSVNEILVYGTYAPSNFSIQDVPFTKDVFILNNGAEATLLKGKESNKKIYIVFFQNENVQYVFNSQTTTEFFNKNQKVIEDSARSITLTL